MSRRIWPSLAMLAAGAGLFLAAAYASPHRDGGIFKVAAVGPGLTMDPQVTYYTTTWWLEYATAAKLFNFPDKRGARGSMLVPEVARGYRVSKDGRRYTFFLRRGFRFSDGTPVRAKHFAYAIKRALNPNLQSPGAQFIRDSEGVFITSYKARRNRLVIRLARPAGQLISILTVPFFQATSTKLPLDREVSEVRKINEIPSAGPYTLTYSDPQRITEIQRNPYYRDRRPRHLKGVAIFWNEGKWNTGPGIEPMYDEMPVRPEDIQALVTRFGVNQSRFWVKPQPAIGFMAFNNKRGLFANNPAMRKAVNWVLDRRAYAETAGRLAASPWTHLLPPGFSGSITKRKLQPYRPGPNVAKARRLAAGHFKDGKIYVLSRLRFELLKRDLVRLGFKPDNVVPGKWCDWDLPCRWDLLDGWGWAADYSDPGAFFELLLDERFETYLPNERYRAKIAAALRLAGNARLRTLGKLDLEMMRKVAPLAAMRTYNSLWLFGKRVRPESLVWQGVYSNWSIPRLELK